MVSELTFYQSYHKNYYNQLIHVVGIPSIVWAVFLYIHRINTWFGKGSTILYCLYMLKYYQVDKSRFLRIALFYYLLLRNSFNKYSSLNRNDSRNLAIKVFSFGWILQFIGHGLFEKKAPALLNGFTKSITIGPYFAYKHLEENIQCLLFDFLVFEKFLKT